jgi:hypothetical protein
LPQIHRSVMQHDDLFSASGVLPTSPTCPLACVTMH